MSLLDQDLNALICGDLSIAARWNGKLIRCQFENEFAQQLPGEVGVAAASPRAYCRTEDVSTAAVDDTLVIDGTTYNVIAVEPDGTGVTVLVLSKD